MVHASGVQQAWSSHRNAIFLSLTNVTGAATGLIFWLIMTRLAHLSAQEMGLGYAVVSLGTLIGVLAKGGLDTALLHTVPGADRAEGLRLLRFGVAVGCAGALTLCVALIALSYRGIRFSVLGPGEWALAGIISILLVLTWLQDAYFLAEGRVRFSLQRNLVLSGARLLLPLPILALALPLPVPTTWALALGASALAAIGFSRTIAPRGGRQVPRREFLTSAARNLTGGAAEFLPGLLLVPIVLALFGASDGPAAAAYFGMAWTAASVLFLTCGAISRGALADMVRTRSSAAPIRRAALQMSVTVLPAALGGALLGSQVMGLFGTAYAANASAAFRILCLSALVVAPFSLYLAVLRAEERPVALVVAPLFMVLMLLALAPLLGARLGLPGIAVAWVAANLPFAALAVWTLVRKEVTHARPVRGHPHQE
ncbi:MAG: lipopolysaccharide biosynthesis protein [Thermoplasmatota archaeon]